MKRFAIALILCLVCGWTVCAKDKVTSADLQYGDKQVAKMLSDRPAMKNYRTSTGQKRIVTRKDSIWQWVAKQYGTRVSGARVEWDNKPVEGSLDFISEHDSPEDGQNGRIRIRSVFNDQHGRTRNANFDELWSACVYQVFNIQSSLVSDGIYNQAVDGELSREEWVRLNTQLDHKALLKEIDFFRKVWVPWCKQHKHTWDPEAWDLDTPTDYTEWIRQYQVPGDSYIKYWQDYYDEEIVPYLKATGKKVPKDSR